MATKIENKIVIRAIVFLLIFIASIWGIIELYAKVGDLRQQKAKIESQIQDETAILEELKNLGNAEEEIEEVMSAIPDGDKMPDFISQLSELAKKSSLSLMSISPASEVSAEQKMKKKDVAIVLEGNKNNFKEFIASLESLSRFTAVTSIKIDSGKKFFSTFTVNLSIYYF